MTGLVLFLRFFVGFFSSSDSFFFVRARPGLSFDFAFSSRNSFSENFGRDRVFSYNFAIKNQLILAFRYFMEYWRENVESICSHFL